VRPVRGRLRRSPLARLRLVEFTDIKAPEPVTGVPPWGDPQWVAGAQGWIDAQCAAGGLVPAGPVLARGRPYSVVARVPTSGGAVWFKASPPASAYEPVLLAALAGWAPSRFAAPLAIEPDRAWTLTRDGGRTLREHLARYPGTAAWHGPLRDYARLQLSLIPHAGDLLAMGLADLRPASVPGQLDALLGDPAIEARAGSPGGMAPGQHAALRALAPRVRDWCAELAGLGIPASLDHGDFHPNNILAASGTPFDWGDAAVGHPFASLLVTLRAAAAQAGLPPRAPELAALTEAYLQPWLDAGHPRAVLDRALPLALRIAPLARALAWGRVFPCYLGHRDPARHAARALAGLLQPDPLAGSG
jgi:Phosphotransferase enzyme family